MAKFASRSANVQFAKGIEPFIAKTSHSGWSGETPHGLNSGRTEVEIDAVLLQSDASVEFADGSIWQADIYQLPNEDKMAVIDRPGSPREIGILKFYSQASNYFKIK